MTAGRAGAGSLETGHLMEVTIMGRETTLFKSEERKSRDEVCAFLRSLADRLETGRLTLRQGDRELELDLPGRLVLEVKAEDEETDGRTERSLEIELTWWEGMEAEEGLALD
jgi:amphi-Trp domain-containing protein